MSTYLWPFGVCYSKLFNLNQAIICSSFPVCPAPHPRELPWPDPHHPQGLRAGLLHPHDGGVLRAVGSAGEGGGCQTVQVSSQQKHIERKPIKRNITKALQEHRFVTFEVLCTHKSSNSIYGSHKCMTFSLPPASLNHPLTAPMPLNLEQGLFSSH